MNITDRTNLNRTGIGIFDDGKIASPIGWSINQQYQTLIIGDAYCGKSSYISSLVRSERLSNAPITMSDDQNEVEFWVKYKDCKAIFKVKDTGSM
jgi:GTPase SAR1 family protein